MYLNSLSPFDGAICRGIGSVVILEKVLLWDGISEFRGSPHLQFSLYFLFALGFRPNNLMLDASSLKYILIYLYVANKAD